MRPVENDNTDLINCADMLTDVAAALGLVGRHGQAGTLTQPEAVNLLGELDFAAGVLRTAHAAAAAVARAQGASWQQIGDALDITRQAAQQRFGGQPEQYTCPTR